MRVLILSNMYPSDEKPFAGIFVRNQYEYLLQQKGSEWDIAIKAMPRRFTGSIGSLVKYAAFFASCIPLLFRRVDILHIHYFMPLGLFGWLYRTLHPGSRLFVTFHGGDINNIDFDTWRAAPWRTAGRAIDCAIAVGPGVFDRVGENLAPRRIILLPAGIDSKRFHAPEAPPQEKHCDLLFAGSFSHRKGIDLLVQALADSRLRDVRCVFVGTGPLRDDIEALAARQPVRILDHLTQDELRNTLHGARFLVLPSRSEPFGLVVSEAMFCGVPAIVSDQPGPAMQVRHRENGLVFQTGSVRALSDAIADAVTMKDDAYAAMAALALGSNREYDIVDVTRQLASEYEKELAGDFRANGQNID